MREVKKEIPYKGETVSITIRMWSAKQRDDIEREFGTPGSRYLNGLVGMIAHGKAVPATLGLLKELVQEETARLNKIGIAQTAATIEACVLEAPFGTDRNVLLEMDEDEFSALAEAVQSVIWRSDDRVFVLKEELSKVLKGEKLEEVLAVVDNVLSGRAEKNV